MEQELFDGLDFTGTLAEQPRDPDWQIKISLRFHVDRPEVRERSRFQDFRRWQKLFA